MNQFLEVISVFNSILLGLFGFPVDPEYKNRYKTGKIILRILLGIVAFYVIAYGLIFLLFK